jgi:hypothetical protein
VRLGLPLVSDQEDMMGQSWQVTTTLTPMTEPALQRVTVTVGRAADQATLVTLNGYAQIAGAP